MPSLTIKRIRHKYVIIIIFFYSLLILLYIILQYLRFYINTIKKWVVIKTIKKYFQSKILCKKLINDAVEDSEINFIFSLNRG